jgi:hypothetical protein
VNAWSPQQQRLLGALGVTVYALAPVAAAVPETPRADPANDAFAALRTALERAAGDRDLTALGLDLGRLRNSAAAKRALWPTLRALRRGS